MNSIFKPGLSLIVLFLAGLGMGFAQSQENFKSRYTSVIENKSGASDAQRLHEIFKIAWEYRMHEFPESATYTGYPGQNDRWTDMSFEAIERRKKDLQDPHRALLSIDREKLNEADKLNYDLFRRELELDIEGAKFPGEYLAVTQKGGPQQDLAQTIAMMPAANLKDYEDTLARLNAIPALIDQNLALLERGIEEGVTPPQITLREVTQQTRNQVVDDPLKAPVLKPFTSFPKEIAEADRKRLADEAAEIYKSKVASAFTKLADYLEIAYVPTARDTIAAIDLPNGREWYAYNVRVMTTTNKTPQEIHDLGQSEVKRIRAEMDKVIEQSGFKGTFKEFTEFLRTDPQFFFTEKEDLLMAYRDIAKRIDPELPKLFGRLPRLPYGVLPIPEYSEKAQTTAYYYPGSPAAGRAGYFYANTYDLKSRPKWEMEALTIHEAVPGHHLQISLAQEMESLPEFRKHGGPTAFVEGWGLYSESLGEEMGFYRDPYSKFGQLTYEMWRAVRLVVDTGMHSLGWSRQQAIDFFIENSGKAEHDITVEIDRYIVWPGQALAYKIGELKMKELRALATKELGEKFDIREFHDALLENGAIPMEVLESHMKEWIENKKRGTEN